MFKTHICGFRFIGRYEINVGHKLVGWGWGMWIGEGVVP